MNADIAWRQEQEEQEEEEESELTSYLLMVLMGVVKVIVLLLLCWDDERIRRPLIRRPITSKGFEYVNNELNGDAEDFRQLYRMTPYAFRKLCAIIREKTLLEDTRFICIEEMLASFLLIVGQNNRYCVIRKTFGRSHFAVSKNFNRMLKALNTITPDMMAKPPLTVPFKIKESTRFYPHFKECIGAMDGTHILATVRGRDKSSYRDRHGKISQNVLAACNFDLEFMYVLAGWEGSAHDSKVLADALSRTNGLTIPDGKYFLVDCGFANRRQFLAPYRGVRYHLQDFCGEGRDPETANELFNLRHASLRNVVERIFGIFKSRFTIFKSAPPFPYETQTHIVLACVGLHNFLRKECRSDEFPPEDNNDSSSESSSDDEENLDVVATQNQSSQREFANQWRSKIATKMWKDATGEGEGGNGNAS